MDLSSVSSKQVVPFLLCPCKSATSVAASTKRQKGGGCNTHMPEELLEQILVRLPVKSLLRLKATCKKWRSLINSPSFIDLHGRRHRLDYKNRLVFSRLRTIGLHQSVGVGKVEEDDGCCDSFLYSSNIHSDSEVVVSDLGWLPRVAFAKWPQDISNASSEVNWRSLHPGAFMPPRKAPYSCVFGPLKSGIYFEIYADIQKLGCINVGTSKFALSNLATRDYKFLNPFPSDAAALLCTLSRKPCCAYYGFGSVHNEAGHVVDYKVVVILLSGQDYRFFLSFVYSLRRGRWDKLAHIVRGMRYQNKSSSAVAGLVDEKGEFDTPQMLLNLCVARCPQLFCNGFWHWLEPSCPGHRYDRVLRFDVAKEVFGRIEGPRHEYYRREGGQEKRVVQCGLLLLDDNLAAVYLPHVVDSSSGKWGCVGVHVWMMLEYGNQQSWTKIYSCDALRGCYKTICLVGLCYSTSNNDNRNTDDLSNSHTRSRSRGSSSIHIQRIFLRDYETNVVVSCDDGAQITQHGYSKYYRKLWRNIVGVSTYLETLQPLTLPH